jgi:hypothetical protein
VNEGTEIQANDSLTGGSDQRRELVELETELRDSKAKKSEGTKLFRQLQEHLLEELRDLKRRAGKNEYRVDNLKSSPLDLFRANHIRVQRRDKKTPPLTITFTPSNHRMHFEFGTRKGDYTLAVGNDGVFWFDTSAQIRKTIHEVATEMLKGIETDDLLSVPSPTRDHGVVRRWLHSKRTADGR